MSVLCYIYCPYCGGVCCNKPFMYLNTKRVMHAIEKKDQMTILAFQRLFFLSNQSDSTVMAERE
jgi:hypothetical protein